MNIKPIPKKVLIHTCTYEKYLGRDEWGGGDTFAQPITLGFVRIEPVKNFKRTTNAEYIIYDSILFYDIKNSRSGLVWNQTELTWEETELTWEGEETDFVHKSKITFDGKVYIIESISPIYADKLHHYELGLI